MLRTAEAVSLGHPDKISDYISSYILDRMIENAPEFLSAYPKHLHHVLKGRNLGQYIQERLEAMGYIVNIGILNGADFMTLM